MTGSTGKPILVIGRTGQLADALAKLSGAKGRLRYTCIGRPDLDLLEPDTIIRLVEQIDPAAIVNAAAYTAVDRAESDVAAADRLNAEAPGHVAEIAARFELPLLHVSTDYVFDGRSKRPWTPDDPVAPLSVYGRSKASGEQHVRGNQPEHLIVRTSWLFGPIGNNFLKTMLRLAAERDMLSVVSDQTGTPTFVPDLAEGLDRMLQTVLNVDDFDGWGTYHLTNSGQTTWYGFAEDIFRQAARYGVNPPRLSPIASDDWPADAKRPTWSVLDTGKTANVFGIELPAWQDAVGRCLQMLLGMADASNRGALA